jgi:hypothetical protein
MPEDVQLKIRKREHDSQIEELDGQERASLVLLILGLLEAKHFLKQLIAEGTTLALIVMTMMKLVSSVLGLLLLLVRI